MQALVAVSTEFKIAKPLGESTDKQVGAKFYGCVDKKKDFCEYTEAQSLALDVEHYLSDKMHLKWIRKAIYPGDGSLR